MDKRLTIYILLATILTAAPGIAGWKIYDMNRNKNEYILLDNYGARFKPVKELQGVVSALDDGSTTTYAFASREISGQGYICQFTKDQLGKIFRFTDPPILHGHMTVIKQFDGYYFVYLEPHTMCSSDQPVANRQLELIELFKQSLNSFEKVDKE